MERKHCTVLNIFLSVGFLVADVNHMHQECIGGLVIESQNSILGQSVRKCFKYCVCIQCVNKLELSLQLLKRPNTAF